MSLRPALICIVLVLARGAAGAEAVPAAGDDGAAGETTVAEAPVIDASDAADHVGEECVVEMVVRATRMFDEGNRCFLNSCKNHRDADNFTVVIFRDGLGRFREADVEDPATHFLDRTIRVRGVIAEHREKPQIVVEDPEQIELVEEPVAAAADPE